MANKKTNKKSTGNHVTKNSQTCVARIASGLYNAAKVEAKANDTSFAHQVNRWLAMGAKADGLKLTPETIAFAGL